MQITVVSWAINTYDVDERVASLQVYGRNNVERLLNNALYDTLQNQNMMKSSLEYFRLNYF